MAQPAQQMQVLHDLSKKAPDMAFFMIMWSDFILKTAKRQAAQIRKYSQIPLICAQKMFGIQKKW